MREFFAGQLDIIFFFYGLSFIVLAAVCFHLQGHRETRMPWFWLGLFGAMHGINEWLDLLAISLGDNSLFRTIRLAVLALSYLPLFEFARKGLGVISVKRLGPWIYLPLVVLASSGGFYGISGLSATIRYFLGLTGGLFSAAIMYKAARLETGVGRNHLVASGIMLGLYILSSGLMVSYAPFFPASWLNAESFLRILGFPIQLLRGILALILAVVVWRYFELSVTTKLKVDDRYQVQSQIPRGIIVAVLCAIIGFGWAVTHILSVHSAATVVEEAEGHAMLLVNHINNDLRKTGQMARTISGSPWIIPALLNRSPENLAKANSILDRYKLAMEASVCYLMDLNGMTIASSNRNDPDSFVGKSYWFRPYFQDAISKGFGQFLGIGVTSHARGVYSGSPVRDSRNRTVGVVAVKSALSDEYFKQFPYGFFVDPNGIIFLSSRPEYLLKTFRPIDEKTMQRIVASRQFGDKPFDALMAEEITNGKLITFDKEKLYAIRKYISFEQWSVVVFASARPVVMYRFFGISVTLFICLLVIGFFFTLRRTRNLLTVISSINARLKEVLDASTQTAIFATGLDGKITIFNSGAERMLGYSNDEIIGKHTTDIFHMPPEIAEFSKEISTKLGRQVHGFNVFVEALQQGLLSKREWTFIRKDGGRVVVDLSFTPQRNPDGVVNGFLGVAVDITERKQAEERIRQLAYHDTLTGLPNRALFHDRLEVAIARALRAGRQIAIMMLDLDKFKLVNDTLGHPVGDLLLKDVAKRLSGLLRKSDTVSRMGGDEFMILLSEIERVEYCTAVAWKIVEALRIPFQIDGHEVNTATSIGIAIFPDDGESADILVRNADIALYRAKESGRDRAMLYKEG